MNTPFVRTRIAVAVAGLAFASGAGQALGAAFALQEQNASGLGHAYAGGAAAAEDVSTIFYNPAGLVRLATMQVVASANLICPSTKLQNSGSQPALFQPLGGTGGDAGKCEAVPNLYLGVPFTDKWSFGLGISVPYGLKTEYDDGWLGRYQGLLSKVETLNVNPVLSWEPTKNLTVGGGVSYQKIKAELSSNVNYAAAFAQGVAAGVAAGQIPGAAAPALVGSAAGLQSFQSTTGDDYSWGWNVGVLWQATPQTRVGAAYRSSIKYTVAGNINFDNPTAASLAPLPPALAPAGAAVVAGVNAQFASGGVTLAIKMPETANLSIFHQFDNKWDLMADVQYTGWSSIQELAIVRTGPGRAIPPLPENFSNTWRVSAGANYRYSDALTFRGGIAYDQTPVNDTDRSPRLPDNDRTWLAGGVQWRYSPSLAFDLGYAYIFIKNASINQNLGSTPAFGLVQGSYKASVNIVGLQLTYTAK
jgi:long-chain fatty acid transport protein